VVKVGNEKCGTVYSFLVPPVGCCGVSGQNATGQNATNIGICLYFFLTLFQFVALPFKMSQTLVISAYHKKIVSDIPR